MYEFPDNLSTFSSENLLWMSMIMIPIAIIGLILMIIYIINLQNLLKAISEQNRKLEPIMVWLLIIPLVNIVWIFIVVKSISESIEAEYKSRAILIEPKPTYKVGMIMAVCMALSLIPILNFITGIIYLVCFIMYWNQTHQYKIKIRELRLSSTQDSNLV